MFKKLKQKKELESRFGSDLRSANESNSSAAIDETVNDGDDRLGVDGHENGGERRSLLNEECARLERELESLRSANETLESQLIQRQTECRALHTEIGAKIDENQQLRNQLRQYQSMGVEKDELMVRNAQLSSQLEQLRLELEEERRERRELVMNAIDTNARNTQNNSDRIISTLNETVGRLEESLADKNKTIKLQQQKLNDIRKTFQRDLLSQSVREDNIDDQYSPKHGSSNATVSMTANMAGGPPHANHVLSDGGGNGREINFTYLRNVIFRYMVNSECENVQLVKAISVLLNFTKEEERLIKETLEWRMSWFAPLVAAKPSLPAKK